MRLPNRRNLLMFALPITVVAVGAPYATYRWLIPADPLDANATQLGRWLVTYEVSDLPRDRQEALVDHIQSSLDGLGKMSSGTDYRLSEPQQKRLLRNAARLQRVWFELRSRRNSKIANNAKRVEFLHEQVETLLGLAQMAQGVLTAAGGEPANSDAMSRFLDNITQWKKEAHPVLRQQMTDAIRDGLLVYLGYFDLRDQAMDARKVLAIRVAETLDQPGNSRLPPVRLAGDAGKMLQANAELLLEAWFHVQAQEFVELDAGERNEFVRRLIDRVTSWNLPQLLSTGADPSDADAKSDAQAAMMLRLQKQVQAWIERADAETQPALQQLSAAVQQQILWSSLRAFMPGRQ